VRDANAEFEAMRPHRELLDALGCEVVVVAETTRCIHGERGTRLSQRPVLAPADWPRFAGRLEELGKRLQDVGLRLAYHHHMGTVVQTEDEVDRLMDACDDSVSLLLDTGHLTFAGGDPVRAATRHAGRIAHLHCKDVRRAVLSRSVNRDSSFLDAVLDGVFTVPGDGCVDYPGVLEPVARAGFRGWLVVEAEQDPVVAPSAEYAALGYRNLRRFADAEAFA
jgi:inosose dehydratase